MKIPTENLSGIVIDFTEEFIRTSGSDSRREHCTGEELFDEYKRLLRERAEKYKVKLKAEQKAFVTEDLTNRELADNLLRSIVITYELIKVEELLLDRFS